MPPKLIKAVLPTLHGAGKQLERRHQTPMARSLHKYQHQLIMAFLWCPLPAMGLVVQLSAIASVKLQNGL
jgi:hypothetical protein